MGNRKLKKGILEGVGETKQLINVEKRSAVSLSNTLIWLGTWKTVLSEILRWKIRSFITSTRVEVELVKGLYYVEIKHGNRMFSSVLMFTVKTSVEIRLTYITILKRTINHVSNGPYKRFKFKYQSQNNFYFTL